MKKAKRGSAMPMAVAVLLMLTAFSILILSTTMLEARMASNRDRKLREQLTIDAIAESYFRTPENGAWDAPDGYTVSSTEGDPNTATYTFSEHGTPRLAVTLRKESDSFVVVAWEYP